MVDFGINVIKLAFTVVIARLPAEEAPVGEASRMLRVTPVGIFVLILPKMLRTVVDVARL